MKKTSVIVIVAVLVGAIAFGVPYVADGSSDEDDLRDSSLDVEPAGEDVAEETDEDRIGHCDDLTPEQRTVFEDARESDDMVPIPRSADPRYFSDHSLIRCDGEPYGVGVAVP